MSDQTLEAIGSASARLEQIADEMAIARAHDTERYNALREQYTSQAEQLATLKAGLANFRQPSMALRIGGNYPGGGNYAKASRGEPGEFLKAVMFARSRDAQEQAEGKAVLDGYRYMTPEEAGSKATLGSSAAVGGWIIPNDPVDELVKVGAYGNPYMSLMTTVRGINASGVDIPFRSAAPSRAVIAPWGETKSNQDLAYLGYTATMYTIAQIYDISVQFARKSQGAAEQDVRQELVHAFSLGTAYYLREGSGSGEPYGLMTALANSPGAFTTSHTAAAATVAGSVATAIAKAAGALLGRNRRPEAVVMSALGYVECLTNGADSAGYFIAGLGNTSSAFGPGTLVSPFGIPIYVDPEMADDDMVVGEFSAAKIYLGDGMRIDTSDQAGTRWDTNLIGFRGELEIGHDSRPAVFSGAFQRVTDILS